MSKWISIKMSDYCIRVADGTHATPKPSQVGFPLVTSKNIVNGQLDLANTYLISESDYHEINQRSKVDKNDVLLSMIGSVGMVCFIKDTPTFAIKNIGLLKNNDYIHGKWLYYYLKSEEGQAAIKERLRGTTQQYIPLNEIRNLPVKVPSNIKDMEKIVCILSSLDDKIEVNNQINRNLEEQAKAIFKSWFVDFEPFQDGEFVDSELGPIPDGWRVGKLGDILKQIREPGSAQNNQLPYLPIDSIPMNSLGIESFRPPEEAKSSLIKFSKDDVIIGAMRVYFHRVVLAPRDGITRTTCFVLRPIEAIFREFSLLFCNLDSSIDYAQNTSKGSTMPYAVWENAFANMPIVIPPNSVVASFSNKTSRLINRIRDSYQENQRLIQLRDTLLPKLMSDEIALFKKGIPNFVEPCSIG